MSSYHMYIVKLFLIITGLCLMVVYIAAIIYKNNQVMPEDLDIPDEDGQIDITDIL
jgi:hypothetical protein